MTDTRNETCEARINSHLAGRIADLGLLTDITQSDKGVYGGEEIDGETAQDFLNEYALCLDLQVTMKVQLSTGGPGDELEIPIERSKYGWRLADDHATYRFLDWFDGATTRTDNPAIMAYLENVVEGISLEWAGE